ncbi:hypothetical protein U1872_04935 [Sphingomonas sp. RB3P16]|uniref:hypothetical protein n=1 Tax=Parasphingomonas frigoris TaxID=3096163 RepID=UPI002FCBD5C7
MPVMGGNGGRFVVAGATLLLHGWVDNGAARIAIVPGAPTSAMSTALAERTERSGKPDLKVELRAESFRIPRAAVEPTPAGDADLRIGQDVLARQPIAIDFARHALQPLSAGEARTAERSASAIAVTRAPDGTLTVPISTDGGAPIVAQLDLSSATGVAAPGLTARSAVSLGPVTLRGVEVADGARPIVGLYAFRHMRVIFDLGHDRIWVRG